MPSFDGLSRVLGVLAAILGTFAASVYWRAGLTLSHYDAKAHLVVSRRIFDSLTPSWEQIGAVWLPLPHVINAIPVQLDFFYRTGAFAIAVSIVSFAITVASVSAIVRLLTGSRTGAFLAAALFALNPNVLYLQSTPMTEPLLFALTSLVVVRLIEWAKSDLPAARPIVGWTIVAACLTRYEAWPIVGAAVVAAAFFKWRNGLPAVAVIHETARLTVYPVATVIFFMGLSFASTGQWFVTGGFYVPDPKLQGQARRRLSGDPRRIDRSGRLTIRDCDHLRDSAPGDCRIDSPQLVRPPDADRARRLGGTSLLRVLLGPPVPDPL